MHEISSLQLPVSPSNPSDEPSPLVRAVLTVVRLVRSAPPRPIQAIPIGPNQSWTYTAIPHPAHHTTSTTTRHPTVVPNQYQHPHPTAYVPVMNPIQFEYPQRKCFLLKTIIIFSI